MALNAQYFLKTGGNFVISIKASCIDSTAQPEAVFAREVKKLVESQLKPKEQVRGYAVGVKCCSQTAPHRVGDTATRCNCGGSWGTAAQPALLTAAVAQ